MIGIPIALAYTNISEWLIHKYWLHGLGKNKKSFWSFHWHEHHRESRKNDMFDPQYVRSVFSWSPQGKEVAALIGGALVVAPLLPIAPFFTMTAWYRSVRYYQLHKKAHLEPEWAKEHLPWHYDHHMGKDQNANWCVTHPWFDHVMGTRKKYQYDAKGRVLGDETPESPQGREASRKGRTEDREGPAARREDRESRFARMKRRLRTAIQNARVAA